MAFDLGASFQSDRGGLRVGGRWLGFGRPCRQPHSPRSRVGVGGVVDRSDSDMGAPYASSPGFITSHAGGAAAGIRAGAGLVRPGGRGLACAPAGASGAAARRYDPYCGGTSRRCGFDPRRVGSLGAEDATGSALGFSALAYGARGTSLAGQRGFEHNSRTVGRGIALGALCARARAALTQARFSSFQDILSEKILFFRREERISNLILIKLRYPTNASSSPLLPNRRPRFPPDRGHLFLIPRWPMPIMPLHPPHAPRGFDLDSQG